MRLKISGPKFLGWTHKPGAELLRLGVCRDTHTHHVHLLQCTGYIAQTWKKDPSSPEKKHLYSHPCARCLVFGQDSELFFQEEHWLNWATFNWEIVKFTPKTWGLKCGYDGTTVGSTEDLCEVFWSSEIRSHRFIFSSLMLDEVYFG